MKSLSRFKFFILLIIFIFILIPRVSLAVVKEVKVFGAYSINLLGDSDNKSSMEELEEDYSSFVQTDTLREYFFKDNQSTYKEDLSEALSWLIDNEIIIRDSVIKVNNIGYVPNVIIEKASVDYLNYSFVNRSDAIMYIYKAVFGPIDARTLGIETDNVRVDNGIVKTLFQIMKDHNYFITIKDGNKGGIYQGQSGSGSDATGGIWDNGIITSGTGGSGTEGIELIADGYHYDEGGGSNLVTGGNSQTLSMAVNTSSSWRYTPQGDKYDSIFGDTNIFISDVNIEQDASSGHNSITTGSHGGGGVGGNGGNNAAIQYETDYKQIYYTPGADLLFYRANDCLEIYLQEAIKKGVLSFDKELRTDKFNSTILNDASKSTKKSWDYDLPAYIFNRRVNKIVRENYGINTSINKVLGVNYDIDYSRGQLTITRNNLFNSVSEYFITENLCKMDIYRYIYYFMNANEKKLSNLESDIVNYKYGMELEGTTRTDEDLVILKYLIAKGILNFDSFEDFQNLYTSVMYEDFIPILYRVANPEARLNFSLIQLTDSETAWRARGYSPQTMYIVDGDTPGIITFNYTDEYFEEASTNNFSYIVDYDNKGKVKSKDDVDLEYVLSNINTLRVASDSSYNIVKLGDTGAGCVSVTANAGYFLLYNYNMNFYGALVGDSMTASSLLEKYLDEVEKYYEAESVVEFREGNLDRFSYYDMENPTHKCIMYFTNNIWVISYLRSNLESYNECINLLDEKIEDSSGAFKGYLSKVKSLIINNCTSMSSPHSIKITVDSGLNNTSLDILNYPSISSGGNYQSQGGTSQVSWLADHLIGITFNINNSSGKEVSYAIIYSGNNVLLSSEDEVDFYNKLNNTQVNIEVYSGDFDISVLSNVAIKNVMKDLSTAMSDIKARKAVAEDDSVQTFIKDGSTGGNSSFWSWSTIQDYNDKCDTENKQIQIVQQSDLILYNTLTNTSAFFKDEEPRIAIVGTNIVEGDPTLGVVFKEKVGESQEMYYYIDAVRLLMNAKQEATILSGVRTTALAENSFLNNLTNINLQSSSGHMENCLVGIRALVANSKGLSSKAKKEFDEVSSFSYKYNFLTGSNNDTYWGDYIALSTANSAVNAISKKITYINTGTNSESIAYAVLLLNPVNIEDIGTANVLKNYDMQDLLDSVVKQPNSEEGKNKYNKNIVDCNAFVNWIYGTVNNEYIKTGYLEPELLLYIFDSSGVASMPPNIFSGLTEEQIGTIKQFSLNLKNNGAVLGLGEDVLNADEIEQDNIASYYISSDYSVLVAGDRVYLEDSMFPNLSLQHDDEESEDYYGITNNSYSSFIFNLGSTFKLNGQRSESLIEQQDWVKDLTATVVETTKDGMVTCQIGPIKGIPFRSNGTLAVLDKSLFVADESLVYISTLLSKLNESGINRINFVINNLFKDYVFDYGNTTQTLVNSNPRLTFNGSDSKVVNTGSSLNLYLEGAKTKSGVIVNLDNYTGSSGTTSITVIRDNLINKLNNNGLTGYNPNEIETYITFSFNCIDYTIQNGYLINSNAEVSDFINPMLLSNINDIIINNIINESNGAIPVNEIPDGSLLKVGTGYYYALGGSSDVKKFIGYSHLGSTLDSSFKPKIQDALKSFANHFIYGGNQYINVTHYFKEFKMLGNDTSYSSQLKKIIDATMTGNNNNNLSLDYNGNCVSLINVDNSEEGANIYTPCEISFSNLLKAYPSSTLGYGTNEVQVYNLCSVCNNSVTGALENLSIFTDNIFDATVIDYTTTVLDASYITYEGAKDLFEYFKRDFEKAFQGDLFTLARMLAFIIVSWLVLSSWVCFICSFGGFMPIIDAIKNPVRGNGGGIDLFKIISFGTISADSEFNLARLVLYNLVLSVLLVIIWKTGNIVL